MSSQTRVNITSPVGRLVMGSLYTGYTTDAENKPLVYKNGPDAGKPRLNFFFALAIPKAGEPHWAHTEWGRKILEVGAKAFPQAYQAPTFSWKIEDGDSVVPKKNGCIPNQNEGWKGNWIVKFSSSIAPKVYRQEGAAYFEETGIKLGFFVQVAFSVDGNQSTSQPGVYLNHSMVCLRGFGPEIVIAAVPVAAAVAAVPSLPAVTAALPAIPSNIQPNPGFLQVPVAQSAPSVAVSALPANVSLPVASVAPAVPVPVMTASPSKRMTAKAGGATYEAYKAAGWDDANMIAQGYLEA